MTKKAIILLSGGLDSATILEIAKKEGYECHALSFSYGQKHEVELEYAKKIAETQNVTSHNVAKIDVKIFNNSQGGELEENEIPNYQSSMRC